MKYCKNIQKLKHRIFGFPIHYDVWSKGGWAYPTDEQDQKLFSELGKSEGQIYFAGEHTSKIRGWLQGALESGLNAEARNSLCRL
ncbi:FAD-dependent oxidoreductase [Microcoleus sp. herbarium14]|uniref:FAD-dependent oxidoreductase n=1 Tax=Microcoleus sp. herbarium14 TaxID=3055439 RepID=UPI0034DE1E73